MLLLATLLLLDMPLLPSELLMLPSGNLPTKVATNTNVVTEDQNTRLCNPKRPLTCSMFKMFLFRRLISLSFSGLATLIPPTSIRGKPGKLFYLEMHNFNQYLFCLDLCIL